MRPRMVKVDQANAPRTFDKITICNISVQYACTMKVKFMLKEDKSGESSHIMSEDDVPIWLTLITCPLPGVVDMGI